MKITFVMGSSFTLAGGDRVIAIYADRLQQRGHDVFVVSPPSPPPSIRDQLSSLLRGRGMIHQKPKQPSHFDNLDVPHRLLEVYRPVVDADVPDADVVIATWWITAEWVAKLSASKGAKAYFLQHHEVFDYLPKERVAATWRLPLHKITISRWLVELADKKYGDSTVSLVPNSVETKQFYAPPRQKQPVPTIGLLYSSTPWKGCSVSFAALEQVAKTIPNLKVIAFGSSPPSASLPLPEGVEFILQPAQDAIKDIYAGCDVWLCGSRSEGFHLPPLEAMACRCPVVSTEVGGPLDIIKNGINGYLVPVDDATALADRILTVLRLSEVEWRAMSDHAYATATQYTWEDATTLFEAALQQAIARTHSSELLEKQVSK